MKLTIFHSDKGDCTLVTGKDGKRLLADGGMQSAFDDSVAPQLAKLRNGAGNTKIDVVYVSHIDDDHISGVLKLLDDLVAWKIFEHQRGAGNTGFKQPSVPRPPEIGEIWHNGFSSLLSKNAVPIADQLAENAIALSGFDARRDRAQELQRAVEEHHELATSVRQAVKLSRRIADGQLGIPLNRPAKGKLMMVRPSAATIKLGGMQIDIVAPFEADLKKLRDDWDKWLRASKSVLTSINAEARRDRDNLGTSEFSRFIEPLLDQGLNAARALERAVAATVSSDLKKKLGNRATITPPNLASLMLLVREGKSSILLTGDGHATDAIKGLEHVGALKAGSGLHVNVLKVQHHGAAGNMTDEFAMRITADDYVFCGNGFQNNPELVVVKRLFDARLGGPAVRSKNSEAGGKFRFWFNSSSTVPNIAKQKAHMVKLEQFVAGLEAQSSGRLKAHFMGPQEAVRELAV